jgi:aryl-alcohol dehydrogenase-like predicted oxidoreductase
VRIAPVDKPHFPLALGGSIFGDNERMRQIEADLLVTMEAALRHGVTHFDTASGYAAGRSEALIGQFLAGRREQVFLASKAGLDEMDAGLMLAEVDKSRRRLQTDVIDLYYIHWPRTGKDLRPLMEGLERARAQGKIRAIGVSNFSVEQMRQVAQAGQINAHQLCYNLLWRFDEAEVIPYCRENNIAVVTYSSLAQGVLTGKFPRQPQLRPDDQRARTVYFEEAVWPHVYAAVEQLKLVAQAANRPLAHLALRWVLHQPGIAVAVAGAVTPQQVKENAQALDGEIPAEIFQRMSAISNGVRPSIPNPGNPYRYKP